MIPSTELRIKNWIAYGTHILQVTEILKDEQVKTNKMINGNLDVYDPIPLTAEVLKQCGFSYLSIPNIASIDDFNREGTTHNWTLYLKRKGIYHGDGNFELVRWGDDQSDKLWYVNQWLRVEMKYLHQLQNIFFAISGEELTYNFTDK